MMSPFAPRRCSMLDAMVADALAFDALAFGALGAQRRRLACARPTLTEEDGAYALTIAAPGVAAEELTITATDGRLVITADAHHRSLHYEVALPEDAAAEEAAAETVDGLLTVRVPKREAAAPARIAIPVATAPAEKEAEK